MRGRGAWRAVVGVVLAVGMCGGAGCGGGDSGNRAVPVPVAGGEADAGPKAGTASGAGSTKGPDGGTPSGTSKLEFDGITFAIPAGWEQVPLSAAQRGIVEAKLRIPTAQGPVDMTLSFAGGGIDANLQRWRGQFRLDPESSPETEAVDVDGLAGQWIDLRGTYTAGVGADAGPKEDWRLLGAAVPLTPRDLYVKLTGPRDAVAEIRDAVRDFVRGGRRSSR